jgi:hypothetical protein
MNGIVLRNQMTNDLRLMGIKTLCFCFEFVNVNSTVDLYFSGYCLSRLVESAPISQRLNIFTSPGLHQV